MVIWSEFWNVEHLFCSSYESCKESEIYSSGTDVNIYLLATRTLINAEIFCDDNDTCNIYYSPDLYDEIYEIDFYCNTDNCNIIPISNHEVKKFTNAPSMNPTDMPSLPSLMPS